MPSPSRQVEVESGDEETFLARPNPTFIPEVPENEQIYGQEQHAHPCLQPYSIAGQVTHRTGKNRGATLRRARRVLSTSRVALKLFLAGLLTAGACLAQNWVIGGGLGYGAYRNGAITSSAGSADAGIRNHAIVTGVVTEDLFDHFSGEFRYVYHGGDTFLSSGPAAGGVKAQSHAILYDALFHLKPRTERIRPFVAGGVGAKYYDTTGNVPNPQPVPRIASLTSQSQWKPLFDLGAGVKVRIADRVVVSGEFRDCITVFPDRLFSPASGATRHGMLHQFTPMFSVGYSF